MMALRDWFKHDAWFLADDKIRELGHEFGAQGPLVAEALLELAKRQKTAGRIEVRWSYLAEHAFAKGRAETQRIVAECERMGFVAIDSQDRERVTLTLPKWRQTQGQGLSGAERTAAWRDKQGDDPPPGGDDGVTSHDRHNGNGSDVTVTSPSRAPAKETETENYKPLSSAASRADREREKASDDDRRLCRLLAEQVRGRNPKVKIKNDAEWLRSMRLCREADGNTPAELEQLIRWVFTDQSRDANFWADTIQSAGGLREHFAKAWAKMLAAGRLRAVPAVELSADYLRRRGAA